MALSIGFSCFGSNFLGSDLSCVCVSQSHAKKLCVIHAKTMEFMPFEKDCASTGTVLLETARFYRTHVRLVDAAIDPVLRNCFTSALEFMA